MRDLMPRPGPERTAALMVLLFATGVLLPEVVNGRFALHDFRVYHGAASSLLHSDSPYGTAFGLDSGFFKYAPAAALLFAPLALLPYSTAALLYYLVVAAGAVAALLLADRAVRTLHAGAATPRTAPLLLALLIVATHLHRELTLGNVNALLLALLLWALLFLVRGRDRAGGALIGLALLVKPHFLVLLPLLVLHHRWRALAASLAATGAGLLVPALFMGWWRNLELHRAWVHWMAVHNAGPVYTGGEDRSAVNTLYTLVHRGLLERLGIDAVHVLPVVLLAAIALAFAALVWHGRRRQGTRDARLPGEYLLLLGLVPSITVTDTEHFLFALPLVLWVLHTLALPARPRWLPWAAVPVFLAYGGNWGDALGPLSDTLAHAGVLGMGNVGLVTIAGYLLISGQPRNAASQEA
jgi:hypothetical protein